MEIAYDDDVDVLYVTFEDLRVPCSYVETPTGDILRTEKSSGKIVGVTIPFFRQRLEEKGEITLPEIGHVPFNEQTLKLLHA